MCKYKKIGVIVSVIVVILIIGAGAFMLQKSVGLGKSGGVVDEFSVDRNGDVGHHSALEHAIRPYLEGGRPGDGGGG